MAKCPNCGRSIGYVVITATVDVMAMISVKSLPNGKKRVFWDNEEISDHWDNPLFFCPRCNGKLDIATQEEILPFLTKEADMYLGIYHRDDELQVLLLDADSPKEAKQLLIDTLGFEFEPGQAWDDLDETLYTEDVVLGVRPFKLSSRTKATTIYRYEF